MHAVDILTPEKCAAAEYRTDGCGYARTLTAVVMGGQKIKVSIVCTLCARDEEGHICSAGEYEHTESLVLPITELEKMKKAVKAAHDASLNEIEAEQYPKKPARKSNYTRKGGKANGY